MWWRNMYIMKFVKAKQDTELYVYAIQICMQIDKPQ